MRPLTFVVGATCALAISSLSTANAALTRAFSMQPAQVVPPSGSPSSGQGGATINDDKTELFFVIAHDIPDATTGGVYSGDCGTNGPLLFPLSQVDSNGFGGSWMIDSNSVQLLEAGKLYVQIDSATYPNGAIRGQIDLNPNPQPGDVIVSEIMYNPASLDYVHVGQPTLSGAEWIELFNTTVSDIDIGGWYFEDEDVDDDDPSTPVTSGTFPSFVLRSYQTVVIIPDGVPGCTPTVSSFKLAWGLGAQDAVLQVNADGDAGGALVGGNLSDTPKNDGDDSNDLPLISPAYWPFNNLGPLREDDEILTLNDGTQVIDKVNYAERTVEVPWPINTPDGSITIVPADYPAATDFSTYTATGNDVGSNWRAHTLGDLAGGVKQVQSSGIYGGNDVGSPCYLYGATSGNRAPVAVPQDVLALPGQTVDITMGGSDTTRPFFGLLLFYIDSLPVNGQLIDVASNKVITPAMIADGGYLMPRIPFDHVRYINNGTCGVDSFTFRTHDGKLESVPATVRIFVQCGDVVITEIMYDPASTEDEPSRPEWVELFNTTDDPIDLAGWYLLSDEARSGTLPSYILGARSTAVAIPPVADPAQFQLAWSYPAVFATTNGDTGVHALAGDDLSATGHLLALIRPGGTTPQVTDAVNYAGGLVDPAWPLLVPEGPSIYLATDGCGGPACNDTPEVWAASTNGVDGAYISAKTAIYNGTDIGSPGYLHFIQQGACMADGPLNDGNGDGVVSMADVNHFLLCGMGIGQDYPANCACFDSDADGDIDLLDFSELQIDFNGP